MRPFGLINYHLIEIFTMQSIIVMKINGNTSESLECYSP